MPDFWDNLISGVISGLITGLLILFFRQVWIKILDPKIADYLYRDIRIDGEWKSELLIDGHQNIIEIITLKQTGHMVSGTIRCVEGVDEDSVYEFEGVFKNLVLTASYSSTLISQLDRGTFTLKLTDNGSELSGISAYLGNTDGDISSATYNWKRNL